MPRYKLRTLLILLAIGPPMLAGAWTLTGQWEFWFACRIVAVLFAAFAITAAVIWTLSWSAEKLIRLLSR